MGVAQSTNSDNETGSNASANAFEDVGDRFVLCRKAERNLQGIETCVVYDKQTMQELCAQGSTLYKLHCKDGFGWVKEADPGFICALGIEHRRWFSCFVHYTQCTRDDECAEIARVMIHAYQRMIAPRIEPRAFVVSKQTAASPFLVPATGPATEMEPEMDFAFPQVPHSDPEMGGGDDNGSNGSNGGNGSGGIAERADAPRKEQKKNSVVDKT